MAMSLEMQIEDSHPVLMFSRTLHIFHEICGTEGPGTKHLMEETEKLRMDSNSHGTTGISTELRC